MIIIYYDGKIITLPILHSNVWLMVNLAKFKGIIVESIYLILLYLYLKHFSYFCLSLIVQVVYNVKLTMIYIYI